MCHPQKIRSRTLKGHDGGNTLTYQDNRAGLRTLPLNPMECGNFDEGCVLMAQNSPKPWVPTPRKPLEFRTAIAYDGSEWPKAAIIPPPVTPDPRPPDTQGEPWPRSTMSRMDRIRGIFSTWAGASPSRCWSAGCRARTCAT